MFEMLTSLDNLKIDVFFCNFLMQLFSDTCSYPQILQNNAKYNLIPKKLLVAKRLSQCLHHALPSGQL